MLIDAVELFWLRFRETDALLVRLESGGQSGWGEVCLGAAPLETSEWSAGAFCLLKEHLGPALRGQSILSPDQLQALLAPTRGNVAAKAALDSAWWSLRSATHATSLEQMLGATQTIISNCITLPVMSSLDELLPAIEREQQRCDVLLLKFRPGWDEQMLRVVRQVYPAVPLAVDCDGCCQLSQREMFYRLDDFMLRWIEQPFAAEDLVAHAMLQDAVRTPLCLHQSLSSLERADQALDLGSARQLRIDPAVCGGLTAARDLHEAGQAAGLAMGAGGSYRTAAGEACHQALARLSGFSLPAAFVTLGQEATLLPLERELLLDAAIGHAVV